MKTTGDVSAQCHTVDVGERVPVGRWERQRQRAGPPIGASPPSPKRRLLPLSPVAVRVKGSTDLKICSSRDGWMLRLEKGVYDEACAMASQLPEEQGRWKRAGRDEWHLGGDFNGDSQCGTCHPPLLTILHFYSLAFTPAGNSITRRAA